jgi:protein TonB
LNHPDRNSLSTPVSKLSRSYGTVALRRELIMRWSFWPVSITVHIALGITVLIAPLLAEVQPPVPAPLHPLFAATNTVPIPPEVVAAVPSVRTRPAPSVVAPFTIAPERDEPSVAPGPPAPDLPVGPGSFDPSLLGSPTGISTVVPLPPPTPPPAQKIVRVGPGIREPKRIAGAPPEYPKFAKDARVQGIVILETVINERGEVGRIKVLRSVPLLDNAAITAVQQWRYTPTLLNGVPVSVLMTITINFTLQD